MEKVIMRLDAIFHHAGDSDCYAYNEKELVINLKTGYDVKEVILHYDDPFSHGIMGGAQSLSGKETCMDAPKRLAQHLLWSVSVEPEYKRCRYYFELIAEDGERLFYMEDGFHTEEQLSCNRRMLQFFMFPWMNPSDINRVPSWVNETIWYQIFPDRFCNGDPSLNLDKTLPWAGPKTKVTNEQIYGGDLEGIISKLDYLEELGVTGLYLTPVNEAYSIHKYNTTDYTKIDPQFGDREKMKELVGKAHEHGIRVMMDGVFNHSGSFFKPWMDVVEKGPDSRYYNWFFVNNWPFEKDWSNSRKGNYYSFAFVDPMPKLNTNNPEVIEYIIKVCEDWVKEYDIDGLRLDVANELSHTFCKELRRRMYALKDDFYILGEVWHDSMPWLRGDEFDAVMNYPFTGTVTDFWEDKTLTKESFEYGINRCFSMYMKQTNDVMFNLLDSHDTIRLMNRVKNVNKVIQMLTVLYTMPGAPCIYYGTEVALAGGPDPDCRRCMPWKEIEAGEYEKPLRLTKQLIALRKEMPVLRNQEYEFTYVFPDERVLEYTKIEKETGNRVQVILNVSDADLMIPKFMLEGKKVLFANLFTASRCALKKNGALILLDSGESE